MASNTIDKSKFYDGMNKYITQGIFLETNYDTNMAVYTLKEDDHRSEEHTSELQSLMRISYAVFCLKKKKKTKKIKKSDIKQPLNQEKNNREREHESIQ